MENLWKIEYVSKGNLSKECLYHLIHEICPQIFEYDLDKLDKYSQKLSELAEGFVAISDEGSWLGLCVGYINLDENFSYISFLGRKEGISKKMGIMLFEAFKWYSFGKSLDSIRLEVSKNNFHAQNFYKRQGFTLLKALSETEIMTLKL